jgi:hypothetical protein
MRFKRPVSVPFALLASTLFAPAQSIDLSQYGLGIRVGAYFPSSGEVRQALGSTWTGIGISPTRRDQSGPWKLDFAFDYLNRSKSGNRLAILGLGIGARRVFEESNGIRPFIGVNAGPAYFDYRIARGGVPLSAKRWGIVANVEAGIIAWENFLFRVRYTGFSKQDGFDFSGLSLTLTYQVVRF